MEVKKIIEDSFERDYPKDGPEFVGNLYDIYEKAFLAGKHVGFNQGYSCACATMMKEHGENSMVEDCYKNNFLDEKQLKQIGAEEFDIEQLRPIITEIKRKKGINYGNYSRNKS